MKTSKMLILRPLNASFTPFLDIIKIFSKTFNSHFEPLLVLAIK